MKTLPSFFTESLKPSTAYIHSTPQFWPRHSAQKLQGSWANAIRHHRSSDKLLKGRHLSCFNSKFPLTFLVWCFAQSKQSTNFITDLRNEWLERRAVTHKYKQSQYKFLGRNNILWVLHTLKHEKGKALLKSPTMFTYPTITPKPHCI